MPNPRNPEEIREKLLIGAEDKLFPLIDQLLQNQPKGIGMGSMMLSTFRPFLPTLQDSLIQAIEEAEDDKILLLVEKLEEVVTWLTESNQTNESPLSERPEAERPSSPSNT